VGGDLVAGVLQAGDEARRLTCLSVHPVRRTSSRSVLDKLTAARRASTRGGWSVELEIDGASTGSRSAAAAPAPTSSGRSAHLPRRRRRAAQTSSVAADAVIG